MPVVLSLGYLSRNLSLGSTGWKWDISPSFIWYGCECLEGLDCLNDRERAASYVGVPYSASGRDGVEQVPLLHNLPHF